MHSAENGFDMSGSSANNEFAQHVVYVRRFHRLTQEEEEEEEGQMEMEMGWIPLISPRKLGRFQAWKLRADSGLGEASCWRRLASRIAR